MTSTCDNTNMSMKTQFNVIVLVLISITTIALFTVWSVKSGDDVQTSRNQHSDLDIEPISQWVNKIPVKHAPINANENGISPGTPAPQALSNPSKTDANLPEYVIIVYKEGWDDTIRRVTTVGAPAGELVVFNTALNALQYLQKTVTNATLIVERIQNPNDMISALRKYGQRITAILTDFIDRFPPTIKEHFQTHKCLYRVMDYWGTPAAQNHPQLHLAQYLTPYAYADGNTYMGLITKEDKIVIGYPEIPRVCIWGKVRHYFNRVVLDKMKLLLDGSPIKFELHGTIAERDEWAERFNSYLEPIPDYIINHGVQPGNAYSEYLANCSILLAIGEPYIGPTVHDAIAHGATYIDFEYTPVKILAEYNPHLILNSQHEIAYKLFGEPYIYVVNWNDMTKVIETVNNVLKSGRRVPFVHEEHRISQVARRVYGNVIGRNFC